MSDFPKVTILPPAKGDPDDWDIDLNPRIFVGEDEIPIEVWDVKAAYCGVGEVRVTIEFPASAVEFKQID